MLNERTKARNIVSVTLNPVYMKRNYKQKVDKPFLTDQSYRCQGQSTLVFGANWSPYPYRHSTKPREEKESGLMLTNQICSINRSTLTAVGRRADSPLPATEAMLLQTSLWSVSDHPAGFSSPWQSGPFPCTTNPNYVNRTESFKAKNPLTRTLTLFPVPLPTGGWHSQACRTAHSMISTSAVSWRSVRAESRRHRSWWQDHQMLRDMIR